MGHRIITTLAAGALALGLGVVRADDAPAKNSPAAQLAQINHITGSEPLQGALKELLDEPSRAKSLIAYALPLAKKEGGLSYNGAFLLGLMSAEQKDMKAAETFLRVCTDKAAKLQSVRKLLQSYGGLIELYYENKQFGDSARVCRELLDLKTDDGKPRIVYRAIKTRTGGVDFVEDDAFDSAKRLRPTVYQTYVKALAKQGKYEQALKITDDLLKGQDHWLERHLKGWVLREAGQLDKAAEVYEDVIARVRKDKTLDAPERDAYLLQYKYELSNVYVDLKKIDRATEQLQYLIEKNPKEPGFYNDLGYIWADNDMKLDEAEKLVRKALDLDTARRKAKPNYNPKTDHPNGAYLDSLGWVLFKQKKLKEARDVLQKAVSDKDAQHIEIYDHLGDVLMALGERDAAVAAWQKGLELAGEGRRETRIREAVMRKLEKHRTAKK